MRKFFLLGKKSLSLLWWVLMRSWFSLEWENGMRTCHSAIQKRHVEAMWQMSWFDFGLEPPENWEPPQPLEEECFVQRPVGDGVHYVPEGISSKYDHILQFSLDLKSSLPQPCSYPVGNYNVQSVVPFAQQKEHNPWQTAEKVDPVQPPVLLGRVWKHSHFYAHAL